VELVSKKGQEQRGYNRGGENLPAPSPSQQPILRIVVTVHIEGKKNVGRPDNTGPGRALTSLAHALSQLFYLKWRSVAERILPAAPGRNPRPCTRLATSKANRRPRPLTDITRRL
jgi:hypothetical protein